MAISKDGGSNPTKVIYNGKTVNEVWYKSNPNAVAVKVWPDKTGLKAYYKKVFVKTDKAYMDGSTGNRINSSYYDLYFRGTPAAGYVEYTGGEINNEYMLRSKWVVNKVYSEEPFKLPEDIRGMFNNCYNVTSIDLSLADTTGVKDMSGLFSDAFSLQTIDISGFNTSQITNMDGMFGVYGADAYNKWSALTAIYVGNGWDVSNVTSDTYMFNKCGSLPNWNGTTNKSKAYVGSGGYLSRK